MSGTTSRYLQLRPDNVDPNQTISFKSGHPVLSFTIQSQNAILDPRSIRINGDLSIFRDNTVPPTPVTNADAIQITMDNRLGIFGMMDQLVIRHNKSKQICENIQHYNKYMSTYLGMTSSLIGDLAGHLNETCLIQPNAKSMFENVVCNGLKKSFSAHLPCGFLQSGNAINLLPGSFGGFQIEIHLSPDSNCLFTRDGTIDGTVSDAHYELSNLNLSCEVHDIPADQMAEMNSQTSGALEFNSISSLYTSINTSNAQLQFNLGLKKLQSAFMTFVPSDYINTLQQNGLATLYPSNADETLVKFSRVQFLRGGKKYPVEFDMTGNTSAATNRSITGNNSGSFVTADSQLAKQFAQSVIPEFMLDRSSFSNVNLNRDHTISGLNSITGYKQVPNGGASFGLGMRYSQYQSGQDFSAEQWGVSLDSDLTSDHPQSVYLFFKARYVLAWNESGVQIMK